MERLTAARWLATLGGMAALLVLAVVVCSLIGPTPLDLRQALDSSIAPNPQAQILFGVRLPRILLAGLIGGALAGAGVVFQAILRNPLADPYILGISSGAGVGVLMGMAVASWYSAVPAWASLPALALIGAVTTCAVVYGIAQRHGRLDPYVLLLSGVIVNAFNGAIMLSIYLFVKPYVVSGFVVWTMGSLSQIDQHPTQLLWISSAITT